MPGLDFASAELLGDWAVKDPVFLPVSEGYHYYKIDVNNAINNLYVYVESYDPNAAGSDVQLFDSSETQYEDSPSPHHTILYENAPVGTNYIRVSDLGVNGNLTYRLTVYLVENGIHPTDLLPSDMTDIEMNSMQGVLPQIDNIESLDVELSHIVTADAPNPRFGGMLMSHNVQLNVDRYGGIVIDGKHNNRILGNTGTPQHSINGTVKNEGVPLEDKVVRLYDRDSGELIDTTYTNNLGQYSFKAQIRGNRKYYVIAFDNFDAPILQATIHDYLDPILET